MNIPVSQAKAQFAELIRRVEAGEEIVLTRNGKVVAAIVKEPPQPRKPILGAAEGEIWMADDFDTLGPEWDTYMS